MSDTIVVTDLSKWFGLKVAVSELTIGFRPGVTGLLGPNGAGKTTLLRVIAGLQRPSQGQVRILGVDPRQDTEIYRKISLVPEDESIYERLTGRQFVELAARLAKIDHPVDRAQAVLVTVGLADAADRALGGFSKGMRQRAKVAAALDLSAGTVFRTKRRFAQEGLASALSERPRPPRPRKLDDKGEAHLIALACSPAPEGHDHWTLRLLAGKVVELGLVPSMSHEGIRKRLKKTRSNRGRRRSGASRR